MVNHSTALHLLLTLHKLFDFINIHHFVGEDEEEEEDEEDSGSSGADIATNSEEVAVENGEILIIPEKV